MNKKIAPLLDKAAQLLDQGDMGSALKLYAEVLAADEGNAAAAMGAAMIFNRTGRPADAVELLRRIWTAMNAVPGAATPLQQAGVLAQLGLGAQQLGRLAEAIEFYKHANRLSPSADLERRIHETEPLLSNPAPVQQLILHGRQLHMGGRFKEAAGSFAAALKLHPDSPEALHGMALALRLLRQPEEAIQFLQRAIMLMPDRPEYFNDLGMLFQDRADFVKAVSFHRRAIKVNGNFVSAWINLGVAYKRMGEMEEALAAYRKALAIQPRSPEALNNLGNLLRVTGALDEARAHLLQALALRPGYVDAQANLAAVEQALADATAVGAKGAKAKGTLRATRKATAKPATKLEAEAKKAGAAKTSKGGKAVVIQAPAPKKRAAAGEATKVAVAGKTAAPAKKVAASPKAKAAPVKKTASPKKATPAAKAPAAARKASVPAKSKTSAKVAKPPGKTGGKPGRK